MMRNHGIPSEPFFLFSPASSDAAPADIVIFAMSEANRHLSHVVDRKRWKCGNNNDAAAEDIQTIVYTIGKEEAYGFENLRDWFRALYETLLGSQQGPRMGSFIALYGIENTRKLIAEALLLCES